MRSLKEAAVSVVAVVGAVAVGSLLFVTAMMPFVFPVLLVIAGAMAWRRKARHSHLRVSAATDAPRSMPARDEEARSRSAVAA